MIVTMHFGDGSWKEIEVESGDPEMACIDAVEWVRDNAWVEATDDQDQVVASARF